CLYLAAQSSVYYAYYFGIAVALFVVLHLVWRCPAAPGAYLRVIALGALVVVALVPTFIPYALVRDRFVLGRGATQAGFFSAWGAQYLGALLDPRAYLAQRYVERDALVPLFGLGT